MAGRKTRTSSDTGDTTSARILDAAEELFSLRGYYGASLRDITALAGVKLALANYYFGPKEDLFRQVIARRADEHFGALNRALDDAAAESAPHPPSVERIIHAYCQPVFDKLHRGDGGWRNYIRLLGQTADSPQYEAFPQPMNEVYDPVNRRYVAALAQALPGATEKDIFTAFYFLQGTVVYAVAQTGGIDRLSNGVCSATDFPALLERITPFCAAGFYRLAGDWRR